MKKALTFDDVLLKPGYSEVLPRDVDTKTRFSRCIKLKIPLVSAAMDTVTGVNMAITLAQNGGIGVIHKNLSIEEQTRQVKMVKRKRSDMIDTPFTLGKNATVRQAKSLMSERSISGIPIVDNFGKLIGIVTKRDILFEGDSTLLRKVMTKKVVTAPLGISQKEATRVMKEHRIEKLPIVDAKGILRGLITMKDIFEREKYPLATVDENGHLRVAAAIGVGEDTEERFLTLIKAGVDALVIDTAHGHSENVARIIKMIRKKFGDVELIAGNIATAEAARFLIRLGVDAVKVGVGPGSICTARIIAGIGVPQLTAILEVARIAKKYGIPVIADGGIRYSGDIVKALAAGADSVMIGNLFAGTDEAPGEEVILEGRKYKIYRGMGSIEAMSRGSAERYRQEGTPLSKLVPEGIVGRVPYRGKVADVVYQLIGGLRSGMGYCGAKNLLELRKKAKFVRITRAGAIESHPHDIIITEESPNYPGR